MIDGNEWFVVVNHKASTNANLSQWDIPFRLFQPSTETRPAGRFRGQPVTNEDDGMVVWQVVYSRQLARDGNKRVAFVTNAFRYKNEGWEHE